MRVRMAVAGALWGHGSLILEQVLKQHESQILESFTHMNMDMDHGHGHGHVGLTDPA